MRNRLLDLAVVSKDSGEGELEFGGGTRKKAPHPLGVAFDTERAMDGVFQEVQCARQEIALLLMDVKRLGMQNGRFLTSVRRISTIKRDANSIARDIRARGESVCSRLRALEARRAGLEAGPGGPSSALARIARSQHAAVARAFRDAMLEYGRAEADQREHCKARIRRQAGIAGVPLTDDRLEEMIETGRWDVLGIGVATEGRGSRAALAEIGRRRRELLELEARVRDVHGLFLQLALLVEEQNCAVESVEANVRSARDHVAKAEASVKRAVQYERRNPCRRLLCCCLKR